MCELESQDHPSPFSLLFFWAKNYYRNSHNILTYTQMYC